MKRIFKSKNISAVVIIVCITAILIMNYGAYASVCSTIYVWARDDDKDTVNYLTKKITNSVRENFVGHEYFSTLYGLTQNALGYRIIGNYDFIKSDDGMMIITYDSPRPNDNFLKSVEELSQVVRDKEIPCIYVEFTDRGANFSASDSIYYSGAVDKTVTDRIEQMGIDVIRMSDHPESSNEWFRTDEHLTTRTEFDIAGILTQHMTERYGLVFPQTDVVYDPDNYTWESYDFAGSNVQSGGIYFTKEDSFETFIPTFETSLRLTIPDGGTVKAGDFYEVMTNQFDKIGEKYLVRNYGNISVPYYYYDNLMFADAPRLLIISDSTFMRGFSFLTLNASHLTVIDPRFLYRQDYLSECLSENDYDAVILFQGGYYNNVYFKSAS